METIPPSLLLFSNIPDQILKVNHTTDGNVIITAGLPGFYQFKEHLKNYEACSVAVLEAKKLAKKTEPHVHFSLLGSV